MRVRYVVLNPDSGGYVAFDLYIGRRVGVATDRWSKEAWLAAYLNRRERLKDS